MSSNKILQREKDLRAKIAAVSAKAMPLMETAEKESRELTAEERTAIEASLTEARELKAQLDALGADRDLREQIAALSAEDEARMSRAERRHTGFLKSLGQQFVESEAGEWLKTTNGRRTGAAWTSPSVELIVPDSLQAATLSTDGASGGDLIVSQYRAGIVPVLFKRLTIADLLASGTTDSNSVTYMKESSFTNAAAAVAEGAAKPESTLVFDQVTDQVKKLAHWLPVTEEMLEDVAQVRSYIDARLRLGVELTEEDQLLNGSGSGANIQGILNRSGLHAAQARSTDTNADAIFKQIWAILTDSFLMPDGVVINPTNWQSIALSKDSSGQYYGAGPFAPMQARTLWGLPVVVTPTIAANTGLVGAFRQGAQVFRKGGIRVEASNSHADFFVKNLVAIRAEERLALAVYRPGSFGTVTGLN